MKRLFNKSRNERREVRHARVRATVQGTADIPRLSVFRGIKNMTLQLIDDTTGKTLCQVTTQEAGKEKKVVEGKTTKVAAAYLAGQLLAKKAKEQKIEQAVFDRGGYRYHGRVAAAADGAREGGLQF